MTTDAAQPGAAISWWAHQQAWFRDTSRFRVLLKSRQIGASTMIACEALLSAAQGETVVVASASERQAREIIRKASVFLPIVKAAGDGAIQTQRESAEVIELSTGGRIVSVPASAETIQGYAGSVYLDEYGWARDQDALWMALTPTISSSRRFRLSVVSTPRGRGDRFHKLWTESDPSVWSKHKVTVFDAVAGGAPIDVQELQKGIADETIWRSSFLCEFIDEAYALLPYDLLQSCTDDSLSYKASLSKLAQCKNLTVGVDIGRVHDLTVFAFLEAMPTEWVSRGFLELKGVSFDEQENLLNRVLAMPNVRRVLIDSTGLGMQLCERARRRWQWRVIPVTITAPRKEDLCQRIQRAFHRGEIIIPNDQTLLSDLHSVERQVTSAGNLRFAAARNKKGHADRFTALALALRGCDRLLGVELPPQGEVIMHVPPHAITRDYERRGRRLEGIRTGWK